MKTATVRELRNNYRSVLDWVESGEEVAIRSRGKIVAHLTPVKTKSARVDWSQSAAARLERPVATRLTAAQAKKIRMESQGKW